MLRLTSLIHIGNSERNLQQLVAIRLNVEALDLASERPIQDGNEEGFVQIAAHVSAGRKRMKGLLP